MYRLLPLILLGNLTMGPAPGWAVTTFEEAWSDEASFFELAEMDGQQGLDVLVGDPTTNRLEVRSAVDNALIYQLPVEYSASLSGSHTTNLDGDSSSELIVYTGLITGEVRVGLFEVIEPPTRSEANAPPPQFGISWDTVLWATIDEVLDGDFDGSGQRDLVLLGPSSFQILNSLDGTVKYDWIADGPGPLTLQHVEVVDIDQDGRDELLVRSFQAPVGPLKIHVIQSTIALGVGDGPAFESRLLDAQNAPNPFTGQTQIAFTLPARARVAIHVYDAVGRRVRTVLNESREAGRHAITWDGLDDGGRVMNSGVYFYDVEAGGKRVARKMLLVR